MRFGSLFTGIGGLDLGLERAGMQCVWQVEIDDYASRVLAKHWPAVRRYPDVRLCGPSAAYPLEPVELIAGGFPCQDVSLAGKAKGLKGQRSGLWYEFRRIVEEVTPSWILIENVPGLRTRGLRTVLGDLRACGYDAEWDGLPACAFGAPHRRDRLFIVAYARRVSVRLEQGRRGRKGRRGALIFGRDGEPRGLAADASGQSGHVSAGAREGLPAAPRHGSVGHVADSERIEGVERHDPYEVGRRSHQAQQAGMGGGRSGDVADSDGERCDGRADIEAAPGETGRHAAQGNHPWAVEPDVGRVAHGVSSRVDRLRCLGNAVVPQVAEYVGRLIMRAAHE